MQPNKWTHIPYPSEEDPKYIDYDENGFGIFNIHLYEEDKQIVDRMNAEHRIYPLTDPIAQETLIDDDARYADEIIDRMLDANEQVDNTHTDNHIEQLPRGSDPLLEPFQVNGVDIRLPQFALPDGDLAGVQMGKYVPYKFPFKPNYNIVRQVNQHPRLPPYAFDEDGNRKMEKERQTRMLMGTQVEDFATSPTFKRKRKSKSPGPDPVKGIRVNMKKRYSKTNKAGTDTMKQLTLPFESVASSSESNINSFSQLEHYIKNLNEESDDNDFQ